MNIKQSNTYRKDLSWLHFNDESRIQERQQVKDQQTCMSDTEQPQILQRTNQGSNFLGGSLGNGNNVRASIQFRRESQQ